METFWHAVVALLATVGIVGGVLFLLSVIYLIFQVFRFKETFLDKDETETQKSNIPFRLDLAGGWLDQPWVSCLYSGPVITLCIEPQEQFTTRSGLASSTRETAIKLWGRDLPKGDLENTAIQLFKAENPPEKKYLSGSQDSFGIVFPGLNSLWYEGKEWPSYVLSLKDEVILCWLEELITLVPLSSRPSNYNVLEGIQLDKSNVSDLSRSSANVWKRIQEQYLFGVCLWMNDSFAAQIKIFPNMMTPEISEKITQLKKESGANPIGVKLTGAGGGGYLIVVGGKNVKGLKIKIRR